MFVFPFGLFCSSCWSVLLCSPVKSSFVSMQQMEKNTSQTVVEMVRQHLDSSSFFDTADHKWKSAKSVTYIGTANTSQSALQLHTRFTRHFATFACPYPRLVYSCFLACLWLRYSVKKHAQMILGASFPPHVCFFSWLFCMKP